MNESRSVATTNPDKSQQLASNHLKLTGQHRSLEGTKGSTTISSSMRYNDSIKILDTNNFMPLSGQTNTQPSEAVSQFASEFELMRDKFVEMQGSMA